jgi:predicted RNase H-like HicB family nuclease
MKRTVRTTIYPAVLNPIPGGGYEVSFPDFPGCVTFGHTFEEAQEKGAEVLGLWIEELDSENQVIPQHKEHPIITDVQIALA